MILTDYLRSERDLDWDIALQCGVRHGVIRLPEDGAFDLNDASHWRTVYKRFTDFGITPLCIEPMPNEVHDHIKLGDGERDRCIERVIRMFPIMRELSIDTVCFNWMAHVGWLRTRSDAPERGGATVTAFDINELKPSRESISAERLWDNYAYFIKAVIPEAEKYGIKLALHPDDPPLPRLGGVERIMVSADNIRRAVFGTVRSESLGITMCQANYYIMGEKVERIIEEFAERIFLVHFRNITGVPQHFRETFHDNGDLDMAALMRAYVKNGVNAPIRVDHVPTLAGERSRLAGYDALGRLFAIGYLKGILDATEKG